MFTVLMLVLVPTEAIPSPVWESEEAIPAPHNVLPPITRKESWRGRVSVDRYGDVQGLDTWTGQPLAGRFWSTDNRTSWWLKFDDGTRQEVPRPRAIGWANQQYVVHGRVLVRPSSYGMLDEVLLYREPNYQTLTTIHPPQVGGMSPTLVAPGWPRTPTWGGFQPMQFAPMAPSGFLGGFGGGFRGGMICGPGGCR